MENKIIKQLQEKAFACSMSNKESRARKGAYIDAIVMLKDNIEIEQKKLLLDFANALNEECGFPLNSEGFEEYITEFLNKQD